MKITQLILESLEQGKWKKLNSTELEEFSDEIYDMIDKSYQYIGGYPGINSVNDIGMSDIKIWKVVDVDGDSEPDVVSMEKEKPAGTKFVGGATDGSREAKRQMIKSRIEWLKKSGYYVEASHKIADILASAGVPVVTDPDIIKAVLNKPDVVMVDPENGFYERNIKGRKLTKRLFGNPNI